MMNSNIFSKVRSFFSLEAEDGDFDLQEFAASPSHEPRRADKVIPFARKAVRQSEISVYLPHSFDDARAVADGLKRGKAAVLNLNGVDVDLAKRIVDFISGNIYALEGSSKKIGDNIFIFTPPNFVVSVGAEGASAESAAQAAANPFISLDK